MRMIMNLKSNSLLYTNSQLKHSQVGCKGRHRELLPCKMFKDNKVTYRQQFREDSGAYLRKKYQSSQLFKRARSGDHHQDLTKHQRIPTARTFTVEKTCKPQSFKGHLLTSLPLSFPDRKRPRNLSKKISKKKRTCSPDTARPARPLPKSRSPPVNPRLLRVSSSLTK